MIFDIYQCTNQRQKINPVVDHLVNDKTFRVNYHEVILSRMINGKSQCLVVDRVAYVVGRK